MSQTENNQYKREDSKQNKRKAFKNERIGNQDGENIVNSSSMKICPSIFFDKYLYPKFVSYISIYCNFAKKKYRPKKFVFWVGIEI